MTDGTPDRADLREVVRERYARVAREATGTTSDGCCDPRPYEGDEYAGSTVFGRGLYDDLLGDTTALGAGCGGAAEALTASLGCGVPTAVADLHPGETVLDLGSGAGGDVLISAARVAPTGHVYGLDMTSEMLDAARAHAEAAGVTNVEFLQGYLEEIPLPDATVDVVISNCVINLAADKRVVLAEAARVTRPGGRFAVSDVVAEPEMDEATRADMAAWTGCIAGALTEVEFRALLVETGWTDVEIEKTHAVHSHAHSAIVRAVRAGRS